MADIKGLDSLLRKLNEIKANVTDTVEKSIEKGCMMVEADAKLLCPEDTGTLRRSITNDVESHGNEVVGVVWTDGESVGTNVEYAKYVEFGTTKQAPQPYLAPALEQNKDKIQEIVIEDLKKEIRKVARR